MCFNEFEIMQYFVKIKITVIHIYNFIQSAVTFLFKKEKVYPLKKIGNFYELNNV